MFKNKKAFTLAEALVSLTVLGVIAAISLPIIITNYNDHANVAAQKAMGLDLTHAIQTLIAEDGRLNQLQTDVPGGTRYNSFNEAFVKEKLARVLKIARTCDPTIDDPDDQNAIQKCGFKANAENYLTYDVVGDPDLNLFALTNNDFLGYINGGDNIGATNGAEQPYPFVLANGASVKVAYNPACLPRERDVNGNNAPINVDNVCINIIYDVNGAKGPNQVGRDIGFFTAFYPTKTVFGAPVLYEGGTDESEEIILAQAEQYCADLAPNNKAGLPTEEEAFSIVVNRNIIGNYIEDNDINGNILNLKSPAGANGKFICVHK